MMSIFIILLLHWAEPLPRAATYMKLSYTPGGFANLASKFPSYLTAIWISIGSARLPPLLSGWILFGVALRRRGDGARQSASPDRHPGNPASNGGRAPVHSP